MQFKRLFGLSGEGFGRLSQRILALTGASILAQVLNAGFSVFIARLYEPADFGTFVAYLSIVSILSVGVALRYEMAIPLAETNEEALNLAMLAVLVSFVAAFLIGFLLFLGNGWLASLVSVPHLEKYLWFLPAGLLLAGIQQVFISWMSQMGNFRQIAFNRVFQVVAQGVFQLGLSSLGAIGLLFGFVAGRSVGLLVLVRHILAGFGYLRPTFWVSLAFKYRNFPLFNLPAALADMIGLQLVPLALAKFFSIEAAGFYGLAMRVVTLPSVLVGQAVSQVFYPETSKLKSSKHDLTHLVASMATKLMRFSAPLFGWLYLCAPFVFGWIFGDRWREAGVYASYLSLWLLMNFVSSPLSTVPLVMGQQRMTFYFSIYETVLRLGALGAGIFVQDARVGVLVTAQLDL